MGLRYPLETLREMREQIKKGREQQLASAISAHENARAVANMAREQRDACVQQLHSGRARAAAEIGRVDGALAHQRYCERLRAKLADAGRTLCEAEQQADLADQHEQRARDALRDAQNELEVVKRDYARWSEARAREAERAAEVELDDIVAARSFPR